MWGEGDSPSACQVDGLQRGQLGREFGLQGLSPGLREEAVADAIEQDLIDRRSLQAEGVRQEGDLVIKGGVEQRRIVRVDRDRDAGRVQARQRMCAIVRVESEAYIAGRRDVQDDAVGGEVFHQGRVL